jgi:hypothetical protein
MPIAVVADNVRPIGRYLTHRGLSNDTLTAGDVVYHNATGIAVANGGAAATANLWGVVLQDAASGKYCDILVQGRVTGWTGLTAGALCYISDTDGVLAHSAGSATFGVGWAVSTTDIYVNPNATVA